MAAGRPVVASIAAGNDAAITIRRAEAGIVVAPGDDAAFSAGVLELVADGGRRYRLGLNARRFAERSFDVLGKATQFEETFAAISRPEAEHLPIPLLASAPQA